MKKTAVFLCMAGFFGLVCAGFVYVDSTMKAEGGFFEANTIFLIKKEEKSVTVFNETYYPKSEILERGIERAIDIWGNVAKVAT